MADELRLTEPLSFWGGLDPRTGRIVDRQHPQCGESIVGRVLIMEQSRGSTSSPGTLIEALRLGKGPARIELQRPDMVVLAALRIAKLLYGIDVEVRVAGR
jgi:predicted aconitase with swiveling domain